MDKDILQKAEHLNKERKATKRWQRVVAGLAAVVLIATNGALSLPAETTENQTYCGVAEHSHTDDCYELSAELVCGQEESEGHSHSVACYSAMLCGLEESEGHQHAAACSGEATLLCGLEEFEGHTHDDTCLGEATVTCGLEEGEDHTHTEDCYTAPIVCGKEESQGHAHTDSCYTAQLICGQEESEGHAHTLSCCDTATLSCGREEGEGHSHSESCYGEETSELICLEEVHTHTLACFSDPSADVETEASWESAFTGLTLNGTWVEDLVTVAKTQLGYTESTKNYRVEDDGVTTRGYTRYGDWAGDKYMDWSAAFVAFCLHYAKVEGVPAYTGGTASQWRQTLQAADMTRNGDTQVGDLVFMDDDADGITDHVGIVSAAGDTLTIIVGDDNGSVRQRSNPSVLAVIALPENPNAPTEATAVPTEDETTAPEDETTAPDYEGAASDDDTATPDDEGAASEGDTSAPDDEGTASEGDTSTPDDEGTASEDDTSTPDDEGTASEGDTSTPDDEGTASEDDTSTPNDEGTASEDDTSTPDDEGAASEGDTSTPDDEGTVSEGNTNTPDDEDTASEGDTSTPDDEGAASGDDTSTPNDEGTASEGDTGTPDDYSTGHMSNLITGECGAEGNETNVTYQLDLENNTLTISGSGAMADYSSTSMPWYSYLSDIETVTISAGVTSVGSYAFHGCSGLTSVSIPGSVETIGGSAFGNCANLNSVIIVDGVKTIGSGAFANCTSLTSIDIPKSVETIGTSAFTGCSNLATVNIADGVMYIESGAFCFCTSLTSVSIPGSVKTISDNVFSGCSNLETVNIAEGVTAIEGYAFANCGNLTSINIPSTVTSIGSGAFTNCSSLTVIPGGCGDTVIYMYNTESKTLTISGSGAMADYTYNSVAPWNSYVEDIATVVIGEGVTSIGSYAFKGCTSLTRAEIASTVETIGGSAFYDCVNLSDIAIPDGVTSIGNNAFCNCDKISLIYSGSFGDNITYTLNTGTGELVISGTGFMPGKMSPSAPWLAFPTSIKNVSIGYGITSVSNFAFFDCKNLLDISIPSSVETIGMRAFAYCNNLTSIKVPSSVTSIEATAFSACPALTSLSLPASATVDIDALKSSCTALTSLTVYGTCGDDATFALNLISGELVISGEGAMDDYASAADTPWSGYASYIKSLGFDEESAITHIGGYSFYGCTNLTSVEYADSITSIGDCAFYGCTNLTTEVPNTVTIIGENAFYNCTIISDGLITGNCGDKVTYELDPEHGILTISGEGDMEGYYRSEVSSSAPWGDYAADITTVVLNGGVTSIGTHAFSGCTNLTSVTIPDSVTTIGAGAFYNCISLSSIEIPASVTSIEASAFYGCTGLTSISLPASATVDIDALKTNCPNLTSLKLYGDCGPYGKREDVTYELDLISGEMVISGTGDMTDYYSYNSAPWYKYRSSITNVTINSGVTRIGSYSFYGCDNLTRVNIAESVTCIGDSAFSYCTELETATFAENSELTTIGKSSFRGCTGLTNIIFPDNINTIGAYAFYNCTGLTVELPDDWTDWTIGVEAFYGCVTTSGGKIIGQCGDKAYYELDPENDILTIFGSGDMYDYTERSPAPWNDYISDIETVTIGSDITSVGNYAFYKCVNLTSVDMPEDSKLTRIGIRAFNDCKSLTSIDIPASVSSLGAYAFEDCSGLQSVEFEEGSLVTAIQAQTFLRCTSLQSITIPNKVTSIGYYAIAGCTSLTSITIPIDVTSIKEYAFRNCTSLTEVTLNAKNLQISSSLDRIFLNCTQINTLIIGDTVDKLDADFVNSLVSNATVLFQGENYFSLNSQIYRSELGEPIYKLAAGDYYVDEQRVLYALDNSTMTATLAYCPAGIESYTIPATVPTEDGTGVYSVAAIGSYAFTKASDLTSVAIPKSVTSIGRYAFAHCTSLTSIEIPTEVTTIEACTFWNCTALASVEIPKSVTSIGGSAFQDCTSLTEITLNAAALTAVETNVFNKCAVGTLIIGTSVDTLSGALVSQFPGSTLKFQATNYFTLDADVSGSSLGEPLASLAAGDYYVDEQGVLYALDDSTMTAALAYCPAGIESYTIPTTVPTEDGTGVYTLKTVAKQSFAQAVDLTSVTFPEDAAIIVDSYAFTGSALTSANGYSTVGELEAALPAMSFLPYAFAETGITDDRAGSATTDPIDLSGDGLIVKVTTDANADGSYSFYTGETARTDIYLSLSSDSSTYKNVIVRVYVSFDEDDSGCSISESTGDKSVEGHAYRVFKASNLNNTYCLEFPIAAGETVKKDFTSAYKNNVSDGGKAQIYAVVLTEDQASALGDKAPIPETYHELTWTTQTDDFTLTQNTNNYYTKTLSFALDETGDTPRLYPSDNVGFSYIFKPGDAETVLGVGNDNVDHVEYTAVITVPKGLAIKEDIANAIRNGEYSSYNAAGNVYTRAHIGSAKTNFLYIVPASTGTIPADSCSIEFVETSPDDPQQILLKWTYSNPSPESGEIGSSTFAVCFYKQYFFEVADRDEIAVGDTFDIPMEITANIYYYFSDEVPQLTASQTRTLSAGEFNISTQVKMPDDQHIYAGESYPITVRIKNESAASVYLRDMTPVFNVPSYYCMTSEDLAEAFADDDAGYLTVTVTNAHFCTGGTWEVKDQNGNNHYLYADMVGTDTNYVGDYTSDACSSGTLTITGTADGIKLSVAGTDLEATVATASEIPGKLNAWGFVIGPDTTYSLIWNFSPTESDESTESEGSDESTESVKPYKMYGKQEIVLNIPTHAKDSFQRNAKDNRWYTAAATDGSFGEYQLNEAANGYYQSYYTLSDAEGKYVLNEQNAKRTVNCMFQPVFVPVWRDFTLRHTATIKNRESTTIITNDIMEYGLLTTHLGDAAYDAIPLVANLQGNQALLIPTVNNGSLGLEETAEVPGAADTYYVLSENGTYENVYVGSMRTGDGETVGIWADTVIVSDEGTLIYWYLSNNAADTSVTIYSKVGAVDGSSKIDIDLYLGDHQSYRLWDFGTFYGDTATPRKEIQVKAEDGTVSYVDTYKVSAGNSITYRLTLVHETDSGSYTMGGKYLWDVLPQTAANAAWSKANVTVTYDTDTCTLDYGAEGQGSEWYITDYTGPQDHQWLHWNEDFTITFEDETYIYMTLTFPSGDDWDDFVDIHGTTRIENIFHMYSFEDAAYLDIAFPTEAVIEKGVLESGTRRVDSVYYLGLGRNKDDGLLYYTNPGTSNTYVSYYVSIYNDGEGRMYIESIQDVLPKGFTFDSFGVVYSNMYPTVTDPSGTAVKTINASRFLSKTIEENAVSGNRTRITFSFIDDQKALEIAGVHYDSMLGKYYLSPGTQLFFVYNCKVGDAADTDDPVTKSTVATNSVAVSFYDYSRCGINVGDSTLNSPHRSGTKPNESGSGLKVTDSELEDYGFYDTGSEENTWMIASVDVKRDPIEPDITKEVAKVTDFHGNEKEDKQTAANTDIVTWRITSLNGSQQPINGYTITDVMNYPYSFTPTDESIPFTSAVKYTVYNSKTATSGTTYTLFTIDSRSTDADGNETITLNPGYYVSLGKKSQVTITFGDGPQKIPVSRHGGSSPWEIYVNVSFSKDDAGNEIMSIEFPENHTEGSTIYRCIAIPGNGRSELLVNTNNATGNYRNAVYYNNCYITPEQYFDTSMIPSEKLVPNILGGEGYSVQDQAQITVTSGHATSSYKQVEEVSAPTNKAGAKESIFLEGKDSVFRYTLVVEGAQNSPMDTLVIIDNLPQKDDYSVFQESQSRGSQFRVDLADDSFEVVVTNAAGEEIELPYEIDFSKASGPFEDADWVGEETSNWTADISDARSIRLILKDVPASSTVTLRFNAIAHADSEITMNDLYGKTAWNSFGYSYMIDEELFQSAPEKVGVRFHTVPALQKQLVDSAGNACTAEVDETFLFLIYEGGIKDGLSDETDAAAIANALGDTAYTIASITVNAGQSSAELSLSGLKQYSYSDGWAATDTDWTWVNGSSYTIMELPVSSDSLYTLASIGGNKTNSYTLTYDDTAAQTILAVNAPKTWDLVLNKVDTGDDPLANAWFGLYSLSSEGALTEEEAESYGLEKTPYLTYEHTDENTYYLIAIAVSNQDGKICWSGLTQDQYLVRELRSPDHYFLFQTPEIVCWNSEDTSVTITVVNKGGYELPETGGMGTQSYTWGGMLAMTFAAGALLMYNKKRRRKGETSAS